MQNEWSVEELVASWTLMESDWELIANKRGPTRLGFAVMLKFFDLEARFPTDLTSVADEGPELSGVRIRAR